MGSRHTLHAAMPARAMVLISNLPMCIRVTPCSQQRAQQPAARAQPCLLTTLFAAVVVAYNLLALRRGWLLLEIALTPHTLLGSALSLLLVFRTNASFSRMIEARRVRAPGAVLQCCTPVRSGTDGRGGNP